MPVASEFNVQSGNQLKDAGLIAADAAWQVGGSNKIYDLQAATFGRFKLVVNVTAIEIASNDEIYRLWVQGSSSSTFASTIHNLACLELGAQEVLSGGADVDSTTGFKVLYFHNEPVPDTPLRYIRGYTDVTGTIATGINFEAWLDGLVT